MRRPGGTFEPSRWNGSHPAFGKAVEEHRLTPVDVIAGRFRNPAPANFTLGAFVNGALIGMATFIRETGIKERHKGRIYGVYVTPSERGKGAGRALLKALVERARENQGLEQILLAVAAGQEAARRLYECFGFQTWGVEPRALKVDAALVDEVHMILLL